MLLALLGLFSILCGGNFTKCNNIKNDSLNLLLKDVGRYIAPVKRFISFDLSASDFGVVYVWSGLRTVLSLGCGLC